MYLLSRPSSILVAVLGLGLAISCAPSAPDAVLDSPTPQTSASNVESSSPTGSESTLSDAEVPSTTESSSSTDTTTVTSDVSPSTEEAVATIAPEASSSTANEPAAVFAEGNIAIRGADPVAYFTQGAYVAGSPEYTYDWGGATWQFASAEHRDLFVSNPGQYAPQYGGFCAWAVSQGYTASVDPTAWDIVDGKLYLNFNAGIQRRWQQDIPGHVARANQNWPRVLNDNNS